MTRVYFKLIFAFTLISVIVIGAGKVLGQFRESNTLLYTRQQRGYSQIFLLDTTAHIEHALTHSPMGNLSAIWSPDGEAIAYSNEDGLYVIDAFGRSHRHLLEHAHLCLLSPCWSPDGRWLIANGTEIARIDARIVDTLTGEVRMFGADENFRDPIQWSPVGLVVIRYRFRNSTEVQLEAINIESRQTLFTTDTLAESSYITWSPNGQYVVYVQVEGGEREIYVGDIANGTIWNVSQMPNQDDFNPVWSPDGTHIAFSSGDRIAIVDIHGNNRRFLHPTTLIEQIYMWVDSKLLILSRVDSTAQFNDLIWTDVDTGENHLIVNDMFDAGTPQLSPDGHLLIYFNQRDSLARVVTTAGDRLWTIPVGHLGLAVGIGWSPDSREVMFSAYSSGDIVYIVNVDHGDYFTIDNPDAAQWQPR